jgi:predicted component of type VI protein secretion system
MPAQLVALNDGPSILLDKPILLIGRHPECDIQIDSRKISRRHCCIAQVNDYLVIRDLDSTNGIRINGVRVVEGRLDPGDEVTIGNHRYEVTWVDAHAPAPRPKANSPVSAPQDDDDLLESCDEPIPLPDPARSAKREVFPPVTAASAPDDNEAIFLPDNLELMPNSGSYPDLAGPASGAHGS